MIIRRIELDFFRNFLHLEASFSPGVNIICGENAQGKTNLLEAIAYLSSASSHRARYDKELIAFEKDEAAVRGEYFASEREQRMEILLRRGRTRTMKRNGVKLSAAPPPRKWICSTLPLVFSARRSAARSGSSKHDPRHAGKEQKS